MRVSCKEVKCFSAAIGPYLSFLPDTFLKKKFQEISNSFLNKKTLLVPVPFYFVMGVNNLASLLLGHSSHQPPPSPGAPRGGANGSSSHNNNNNSNNNNNNNSQAINSTAGAEAAGSSTSAPKVPSTVYAGNNNCQYFWREN